MSEAQSIVALSRRAFGRGEQLCLATVVHVEGSAYRKPGARMLLTSGGERAGTISGGCLESEVSRKAWWLTAGGATLERYSSFADEDGGMPYGLGCGGTVWLLLERGEAVTAALSALESGLLAQQPAVIVMALGGAAQGPGTLAVLIPASSGERPASPAGQHVLSDGRVVQAADQGSTAGDMARDREGSTAWRVLYQREASLRAGQLETILAATQMAATHAAGSSHVVGAAANSSPAARSLARMQPRFCALTAELAPFCPPPAKGATDSAAPTLPAYFVQYLPAPPALTIFGAGDDAQPLAALAHSLGWRVTVTDGRANLARRDRFPHATEVRVLDYADPALRPACGLSEALSTPVNGAGERHCADTSAALISGHRELRETALRGVNKRGVNKQGVGTQGIALASGEPPHSMTDHILADRIAVILTHSYEQDRALLAALLPRELLYLGILGPRHRTERLLSEIAPSLGLSVAACFERLHSPIGLDLGAGDPGAVALSVVAEIQAVLHGRRVEVKRSVVAEEPEPLGFQQPLGSQEPLGPRSEQMPPPTTSRRLTSELAPPGAPSSAMCTQDPSLGTPAWGAALADAGLAQRDAAETARDSPYSIQTHSGSPHRDQTHRAASRGEDTDTPGCLTHGDASHRAVKHG